jgi:drug/metabolite transporter (DMT)-like permease
MAANVSEDGPDWAAQAGLALMVGAMLIAPAMDVLAKLLVETVSPATAAAGRFFAQSLVLGPLALAAGSLGRPTRVHAAAGVFLGLALLAINAALVTMPVANVIAIFFVEPLILTLLAALLLGEKLGARRLGAVAAGLVGALVVLRPNLAAYGTAALLPLAAAVLFSFYMLITRAMTKRGGLLGLQFWIGAAACAVLAAGAGAEAALAAEPGWRWPTGREVALFAAVGALAAATHQMIAQALTRVEAGAVAPLQYLEIVSATLLGWLVFGDLPDALTWLGAGIIVASGLYVFHRERLRRAPPTPPAAV